MRENDQEAPFEPLSTDERRVLVTFQKHDVHAVVVGGYAARVHGVREHGWLRSVEDLDLVIETSEENLVRLHHALMGLEIAGAVEIAALFGRSSKAKWRWRDGYDDHYVHLLSAVEGLNFPVLAATAVEVRDEDLRLCVMSREHFIAAKRAAMADPGRGEKSQRDREDLAALLGSDPAV